MLHHHANIALQCSHKDVQIIHAAPQFYTMLQSMQALDKLRAKVCLRKLLAQNFFSFQACTAVITRTAGEGGMSRTAQYLRYCISQMEQLRMIKVRLQVVLAS